MSALLNKYADHLLVANNGFEGIELFKKFKPDIVISDIGMPGMNGIEMTTKIKEINPDSHVIFTTAFNDKNILLNAIELGVRDFIIKPVKKDQKCFMVTIQGFSRY